MYPNSDSTWALASTISPSRVDPDDRVWRSLEQCHLRLQARRDVAIELEQADNTAGRVALGCPATLDDQAPAVLGVLYEIPLPAARLDHETLDLLERQWILRMQQILGHHPQRFRRGIPVRVLGAPIPQRDASLRIASEDRIGREIQQCRLSRDFHMSRCPHRPGVRHLRPTVLCFRGRVPHFGSLPRRRAYQLSVFH